MCRCMWCDRSVTFIVPSGFFCQNKCNKCRILMIPFDCTAKIVEKKWKNLADQFRTKEKSGAKGPTEAAKAQEWRFYNEMSFLKPYIKNNK